MIAIITTRRGLTYRASAFRRRRGLTLLEVLVAAAILGIGLAGAMEAIGRCAYTSAQVRDRSGAMLAARSKMDEILKEPVLTVGTDQSIGVDETSPYDWSVAIDNTNNPDLMVVRVAAWNRNTKAGVTLDTLRRADLDTPPETVNTTATGTTGATQ